MSLNAQENCGWGLRPIKALQHMFPAATDWHSLDIHCRKLKCSSIKCKAALNLVIPQSPLVNALNSIYLQYSQIKKKKESRFFNLFQYLLAMLITCHKPSVPFVLPQLAAGGK